MTVGILRTALEVPSIKFAVVTSSRVSVYNPQYGQNFHASLSDWNEAAAKMAYEVPADHPYKAGLSCMQRCISHANVSSRIYRCREQNQGRASCMAIRQRQHGQRALLLRA
jgi:hypothetical protein